jgi:hypothetical protein
MSLEADVPVELLLRSNERERVPRALVLLLGQEIVWDDEKRRVRQLGLFMKVERMYAKV